MSGRGQAQVDAPRVYARVKALAQAQSADVAKRLAAEGVETIAGRGALAGPDTVVVDGERLQAGAVLIATGAMPRVLPGAEPDGERILNWRQLYDLPELPPELIVVGSGVTGAEFASAYQALGSQVTLVSSRDRVLPHEDADAAMVVEDVFRRRGMTVLGRSRAAEVKRTRDGVVVTLEGGRTVRGSHCLLTVGMVPATRGLGLEEAGVTLDSRGFVEVDRVSRTTARGVYAAGDCTGVMMLASVAAMQGRIAMWHTLGEAVKPIRLDHVAATIFTDPEIATVGVTAAAVESGAEDAVAVKLPLATNARAKMQGFRDGFVKLFARRGTGPGARRGRGRAAGQRADPGRVAGRGTVADRGPDGPDVRGLPLAVRQPDRGGPPADAPGERPPLTVQWDGRPRSGSLGTGRSCWRSRLTRRSSAYAVTVNRLPHRIRATMVRLTQIGAGSRIASTVTRIAQIGITTARCRSTVRRRQPASVSSCRTQCTFSGGSRNP